jgi:hypothetical protein
LKRVSLIFLALILSLAMILPGATVVLADSEKDEDVKDKETKPYPPGRAALLLKAPDTAEANQPVTISVLGKYTRQPVAEAEVYGFKAVSGNYTTASPDFAALLNQDAISLGKTNRDGKLTYKFADPGRYVLVAFKGGHLPGFSLITIAVSTKKRLQIEAPASAESGRPVTIAVSERGTSQNVTRVGIYALRVDDNFTIAPAEKPAVTILKPNSSNMAPEMLENPEKIKEKGFLIGYTDSNGQVIYSFDKAGNYALAAIKDGYQPGFDRINIRPKLIVPQKRELRPVPFRGKDS